MGRVEKRLQKDRKRRKILTRIFLVILIIAICYIGFIFFRTEDEQKETDELLNTVAIDETEITETKTERMLQLEKLKEEYPNIVAWIEIEGTNINYPVMQTDNNDYYVKHNHKGEETRRGAIFLDKDYDWSIPSSNLLVYGHNNDGTMFSELLDYKSEEFYKEHPTIKFTTEQEDVEYEIIAVFLSRVYYKSEKNVFRYYYFVNAENEEEYNNYVENAKKASLYDTGKTAQYGDQLLTLSTCEYSQDDGRFVVVARKKTE